ncbi:MAG TPA: hypothetical protein VK348_09580, partial [Planctomycetota bacterium]|nr:hypothetical protein [Planctomycetota bacterium]
EMVHRVRSQRLHVGADAARHAWAQFAPSCIAGALLTTFVVARVPDLLWLLPGLWQMLFGLGNLAAHRLLPRPAIVIGAGYVAAGSMALWLQQDALSPWAMAIPFALGQAGLAAILWWHLERAGAEVTA